MSYSKLILGTANFIHPYGFYQKDIKTLQSELDRGHNFITRKKKLRQLIQLFITDHYQISQSYKKNFENLK